MLHCSSPLPAQVGRGRGWGVPMQHVSWDKHLSALQANRKAPALAGASQASQVVRASWALRRLVAAAAASAFAVCAGVERVAATTRANRVRVQNAEAAAHQAVLEVNCRTRNVLSARLVDVQLQAVYVDGEIVLRGLVLEGHAVGHTGAAARVHEHAQAEIGAGAFLLADKFAQLHDSRGGHADQICVSRLWFGENLLVDGHLVYSPSVMSVSPEPILPDKTSARKRYAMNR